jgi:hypothetical protein
VKVVLPLMSGRSAEHYLDIQRAAHLQRMRVLALETVVPLVLTATVSITVGFLAAQLFLHAQLDQTLVAPGPRYYLIVALGLVAALAILAPTLPMLSWITGPEAARFD